MARNIALTDAMVDFAIENNFPLATAEEQKAARAAYQAANPKESTTSEKREYTRKVLNVIVANASGKLAASVEVETAALDTWKRVQKKIHGDSIRFFVEV